MKLLLLIFALTGLSCSIPVPPKPAVVINPYLQKKCFAAISPGIFRAVHIIDVDVRGKSSSFIGVTIVDASGDRIRATLLSVEGLVLLDAVSDKGSITIYRTMQQFLSGEFTRGLFSDIEFMFFPGQGDLTDAKVHEDGSLMCRWTSSGNVFEKNSGASGITIIREYGPDHKILRKVSLFPPLVEGLYKRMHLESYAGTGYSLSLELLEGEPLNRTDGLFTR